MKSIITAAIALTASALAAPAHAGPAADALSACITASTSPQDKNTIGVWAFIAMAKNPNVSAMVKVTPAQEEAADAATDRMISRLFFVDCRAQTIEAIRQEGDRGPSMAFRTLGMLASNGMLSHPAAQEKLSQIGTFGAVSEWDKLQSEAKSAGAK